MKCGRWSQLRGTKAEWQPISVWRRVSHNSVIHSNLLYDDVELHPWCHSDEYSSGVSELFTKSFLHPGSQGWNLELISVKTGAWSKKIVMVIHVGMVTSVNNWFQWPHLKAGWKGYNGPGGDVIIIYRWKWWSTFSDIVSVLYCIWNQAIKMWLQYGLSALIQRVYQEYCINNLGILRGS